MRSSNLILAITYLAAHNVNSIDILFGRIESKGGRRKFKDGYAEAVSPENGPAVGEDARGSDGATSSRALLPPPEWPVHAPVPSSGVFWENHFLDGGITDKVTWQFLETYTSDPKTTLRLVFPKAGSVEPR
jgi:hypothetical protein